MAVTYQTEGIKMPEIKKRETTEWIKAVAASYGKDSVKSLIFSVPMKNSGSKPPISATRLLHGHHYFRLL